ncbi:MULTISPECIES: hypothetical protein [Halomonas]|nr:MULTISPECIES: hypothetical protein [Halomonas]MED5297069.1 hypothetical protein [Pseudomonadota bacterium]
MTIAQQILLGIAIASPLLGLTWWAVKRSDRHLRSRQHGDI